MNGGFGSVTRVSLHDYLQISRSTLEDILRKPERYYRSFSVEKNGKRRTICPPIPPLKTVQRILLKGLYQQVRWPSYLHGGIPGRSIITNARTHLGQRLVATYDISDFFPSTTGSMVRACFTRLGFGSDIGDTLARLVAYNDSLPLGAPTSMAVANLVFRPSDQRLLRLCKKHGLKYSRYVDDIAVSGMKDFRDLSQAIRGNIEMLGYKLNRRKIYLYFSSDRQVVTGLVVNRVLTPTRVFIKETRDLIQRCRDEGPGVVADEHGLNILQLKQMIFGRASFVRSVYPKRGRRLRGLIVGIAWEESG